MPRMLVTKSSRPRTERRDTPRIPIAIDAMVRPEGHPFQLFQTRDISLDGAFIEMDTHRIKPKTTLEVALKIPSGNTKQIYRFSAHATRAVPYGVAMVFDHVNTESY